MEPDVQLFLVSVAAMIVVGLPLIRAAVSLPRDIAFEEVPGEDLSDREQEFFAPHDRHLDALGYAPALTFRAANLGSPNVNRLYLERRGSGLAVASALTTGGPQEPIAQNYLELIQELADGTLVTTRNTTITSVFARMPRHVVNERPRLREARALKGAHDDVLACLGRRPAPPRGPAEVMARQTERHRLFCEHQVRKHLLRWNERTGRYHATLLTGLSGVANFLNPFTDDFRLGRFLAAAAAGSGSCIAGALGAPAAAAGAASLGLPPAAGSGALLAATFAAGGVALGLLFPAKHFLWCFLLGYLPLRILGLLGLGSFLGMLGMDVVAEAVARRRMRARIVATA